MLAFITNCYNDKVGGEKIYSEIKSLRCKYEILRRCLIMKILHVLLPQGMGGVEQVVNQLYLFYKDNSDANEVYIAIDLKYYESFVTQFSVSREKILVIDTFSVVKLVKSIKVIINRIKPDVIHTHARRECFLVSVINRKIPHVRTQHMIEMPRFKVTLFEKNLLKKRVCCWISTSQKLVEEYFKDKEYIDDNKIKVVYNGVPFSRARNAYNAQNIFCIICRLTKQKGIDILIEELSHMPKKLLEDIRVDIYGEGPELENICNLIQMYGLEENIKYKGECKYPPAIFEKYDALLMPSRYEGLPLTMLEAMATSTPVATHNVGCVEEFIRNGENGWIIDKQFTWKDFFEEFQADSLDFRSICTNAKETYMELFSVDKMCKSYNDIYKQIILGERGNESDENKY